MAYVMPYLVGGLTALLVMDYLPPATRSIAAWPGLSAATALATVSNTARKGDRLTAPETTAHASRIATVEVIGLNDAAIVYRDRDGRELYRTDPVSNVTVVTKGLALPELTVRRTSHSTVRQVPVELPPEQAREGREQKPKPQAPRNCEPSFSPVAAPSMAHHTGRCFAAGEATQRLAQAFD